MSDTKATKQPRNFNRGMCFIQKAVTGTEEKDGRKVQVIVTPASYFTILAVKIQSGEVLEYELFRLGDGLIKDVQAEAFRRMVEKEQLIEWEPGLKP